MSILSHFEKNSTDFNWRFPQQTDIDYQTLSNGHCESSV